MYVSSPMCFGLFDDCVFNIFEFHYAQSSAFSSWVITILIASNTLASVSGATSCAALVLT